MKISHLPSIVSALLVASRMYYHTFILILIFFNAVSFQSIAQAEQVSFTVDLIHRDSPESPFYNQSITPSELLAKDVMRSRARVNNFNSSSTTYMDAKGTVSPHQQKRKLVESGMISLLSSNYLTTYYFGSKEVKVMLFVDLTVNFVWTPCVWSEESNGLYNPTVSTSFQRVLDDSPACRLISFRDLRTDGNCWYKYMYAKRRWETVGVLVTDKIRLHPFPVDSQENSWNLNFGCAETTQLHTRELDATELRVEDRGVLGMGRGKISFVSQLAGATGSKFSYCLQPVDEEHVGNKLIFGNLDPETERTMMSSPLQLNRYMASPYYLQLVTVNIGGRPIDAPDYFVRFDFGTTMTFLEKSLYKQVEDIVKRIIGAEPVTSSNYDICFNKEVFNDMEFPKMVFHFEGASSIGLESKNVFIEDEGKHCMTILPHAEDDDHSVFGSRAQQNHIMQFDIANGKASFAAMDCGSFNGRR